VCLTLCLSSRWLSGLECGEGDTTTTERANLEKNSTKAVRSRKMACQDVETINAARWLEGYPAYKQVSCRAESLMSFLDGWMLKLNGFLGWELQSSVDADSDPTATFCPPKRHLATLIVLPQLIIGLRLHAKTSNALNFWKRKVVCDYLGSWSMLCNDQKISQTHDFPRPPQKTK